jgi:hypothetical protein
MPIIGLGAVLYPQGFGKTVISVLPGEPCRRAVIAGTRWSGHEHVEGQLREGS